MTLPIEEVRAATRASNCPIADLLADPELDQMIATVVEALVATKWTLVPPTLHPMAGLVVTEAGHRYLAADAA